MDFSIVEEFPPISNEPCSCEVPELGLIKFLVNSLSVFTLTTLRALILVVLSSSFSFLNLPLLRKLDL